MRCRRFTRWPSVAYSVRWSGRFNVLSSYSVMRRNAVYLSQWPKPRLWVILCLVLSVALPLRADLATEYQVKAGFLYNFAKFVTWTPEMFGDGHQQFNICTSGGRPWDRVLEETLRGKTIGERTVTSRSVSGEKEASGCQILFIPISEEPKWESAMADAKLPGVLTVTEANREGRRGRSNAIVTFVVDENRIRFVINAKAAEKAGLVISSKLLSLALEVQR